MRYRPDEPNWQARQSLTELPISAELCAWLTHPGSFMTRLRKQGFHQPRVQLLRQSWAFPERDERDALGITYRSYALVREVLIVSGSKRLMYARTVFPLSTLTGKQRQLARLKNRSLGSVLFKDPSIQRSDFVYSKVTSAMSLHTVIAQHAKIKSNDLYGRRSLFHLHNKPILLTEIFLPDIL